MSSGWTHSICSKCFSERQPERQPAATLGVGERFREVCCFCGFVTDAGIYYRAEPNQAFCDHEEKEKG